MTKRHESRKQWVLHLQNDLSNLPKPGDKLPRKIVHGEIEIKGIRRISMAMEYARILGVIPSFVSNGEIDEIQDDLEKIKAKRDGPVSKAESS